jgi:hypothetical protein
MEPPESDDRDATPDVEVAVNPLLTRAAATAAIARQIATPSVAGDRSATPRVQTQPIQRDDEDASEDRAADKSEAIYDALNWWDDEEAALAALSGHDSAMRSRIANAFAREHGFSLRSYLKDQLGGDDLVRAIALLDASHTHDPHTAIALALIPLGTRDAEIFRILEGLSLAGRQELETRYNRSFSDIGSGSLKKDLKDDLSGWREQKSLALLHRDLTSADHLYFDSVAITGTHTDSVVSRIQREWQNPGNFANFENDWNRYVRNQSGWSDETWTDETLYQAMDGELSGEEWGLVRAVLDGYEAYKRGEAAAQSTADPGERQRRLEDVRLQVAEDSLTAATKGAGTNESEVFRAVTEIRQIYQGRIDRARQAGDAEGQAEAERAWEDRRTRLMPFIEGEMYAEGHEYQRVRLLTMGNLDIADEVYLAGEAHDNDRVVTLVTDAWAKGNIGQLLDRAAEPKTDETGQIVRPSFRIGFVIPITRGAIWSRMMTLVNTDYDEIGRGANRLKLELDQGDSDSDLKKAYDFLKHKDLNATRRNAVVDRFAAQNLGDEGGGSGIDRFVAYIFRRYENSHTCYEFQDLLQPSADPQEMATRARGRQEASETGVMNTALNVFVGAYDVVSGEDTAEVVGESADRLEFIAAQAGARPDELEAMLAITGARDAQALASLEYTAFRARLDELRSLQRSIAEAIATTVELVVEAALTIATGGAAAGALLASLSSAVAGMLVREMLLGQDYDLLSRENAQKLVTAIASHGFNSVGRGAIDDILNPERLRQLSRAETFLADAASEAFTQVNLQVVTAGFEGKFPTAESIGAAALSAIGNTAGAGTRGLLGHGLDAQQMARVQRLRHSAVQNITQQVISGVSEEGAALIRTGTGNLTVVDLASRFGSRTAQSVGRGLTNSVGEVGGQAVATRREARRQEAAATEEGGEPGRDLSEAAARPPATGEEVAGAAAAGVPRSPGSEEGGNLEQVQATRSAIEDLQLPEATVMMPPERRSLSLDEQVRYIGDAQTMYENTWREDPSREAAIYRNSETGEYIIIQGDSGEVYVEGSGGEREAPQGGGVSQRWKELLDGQDVGHWVLMAHSHPVDPTTGVVSDVDRFPSGASGDFQTVFWASQMAGGEARSSTIHYETPQGPDYTRFGYDPQADSPYWIEVPDPETGRRQRQEFADLEGYHAWMRDRFNVDLGEVPDAMRSPGGDEWDEDTIPELRLPHTPESEDSGAREAGESLPDLDRLLSNIPLGLPPEGSVEGARKAIAGGSPSAEDFQVLIQQAVADSRTYRMAQNPEQPLTSELMRGACGVGRDISASSLASLLGNSSVPVRIDRHQARQVFGVEPHGFSVVTFLTTPPVRYLVDPTFAQFLQPGSSHPLPGGSPLATALVATGFVPLTPENARLYALAMGVPETEAATLGDRLFGGEGAVTQEMLGQGQSGPLLEEVDLPNDDIVDVPWSIEELGTTIGNLQTTGDPHGLLPHLQQLRLRLQGMLSSVQSP